MKRERARQRAVVVQFAAGQMTAPEGARRLGVSRTTYYVGKAGEKQRLQQEISELQRKLFVAEKTTEVRDMLHAYELHNAGLKKRPAEKNKGKERSHNLGAAFSSFPLFLSEKQPSECPAGISTYLSVPLPCHRLFRPPYRPFPPPSAADLSFRMLPKRRPA